MLSVWKVRTSKVMSVVSNRASVMAMAKWAISLWYVDQRDQIKSGSLNRPSVLKPLTRSKQTPPLHYSPLGIMQLVSKLTMHCSW